MDSMSVLDECKYVVYVKQNHLAASKEIKLTAEDYLPQDTYDAFGIRHVVHTHDISRTNALLSGVPIMGSSKSGNQSNLTSWTSATISLRELIALYELSPDIRFIRMEDAKSLIEGINTFLGQADGYGYIDLNSFNMSDIEKASNKLIEIRESLRVIEKNIRDNRVVTPHSAFGFTFGTGLTNKGENGNVVDSSQESQFLGKSFSLKDVPVAKKNANRSLDFSRW